MSESKQVIQPLQGVELPEVAPTEYDDMTDEQLEEAFRAGEGDLSLESVEEAPQEAAPEPEPEEAAPEPEEQVAAEDTPAPEAPPADDPVAVEEPELSDSQLQLQEMQLRMDQMTGQRELSDLAASRNAGRVGDLQKKLEEALAERSPAPADDQYYEDTRPAEPRRGQPQHRASSAIEGKVAELQSQQMMDATERIYSDFLTQLSNDLTTQGVEQTALEAEQTVIMDQITPTLKDRFEPFGDISQMQPKTANKLVKMVLQSAYTDVKLAKVADTRRVNLERKATQIDASRQLKQAASPSGSGGTSVQEPPPKRVEDMTAEEADAALIALYGNGESLR